MATETTSQISILLADDHDLVRDAVAQVVGARAEFGITLANTFGRMVELIEERGGFDVVLMDVAMPGVAGIGSVQAAVKANAEGAVVLFSGNVGPDFVMEALGVGAMGFIPKTLPLKSLAMAIQLVASGQVFVPMPYLNGGANAGEPGQPKLSPQEMRVLQGVAGGKTNKEIAWTMNLSEVTVKMHMRSVCSKLRANNRTHAAMIAKQSGIV